MRTVHLVSILALMAATPTLSAAPPAIISEPVAAAQASAHPTYSAAQFFENRSYQLNGGSRVGAFSPDGRSILISSDQTGVFNGYALPIAGGDPVPLTNSTTTATFAISYFPTDGRVLVTTDGGGDELNHVYVRELDGTLRDLTPGENLKAGFLDWSDDGKTFYLTSNARDPASFDVIAYDAETYATRVVFQNDGFFPDAISGDGRWLALSRNVSSARTDLYLVDLQAGSAPRRVTPEANISHGIYDFTPDNASLIYGTDQFGEFTQARRMVLATGDTAPLIEAEWDVSNVAYSPSGRYRVSSLNADGSTEVTITDTTNDRPVAITGIPGGDVGAVRFNPTEDRIAFTVLSDTSPSDIFTASLSDGVATRLTTALNPQIDEDVLVEATVVRYPAEGGVMIPSILYRPKGASAETPVPAIVLVHGGPGGQTRRGYNAMVQHLVNHGYAVLGANNRGSSGYGKTFFHLDDKAHGEADLRDIVAGGQWLRDQDWVADDQVVVMGGSYGGYMTAAALAFHPTAFEAGVNIFGVTNWERTLQSIPAWWGANRVALFDEMGDPATDAERHRRISPLFHTENIQRPMLVVQGANDPRVLQVESDELVAAIRANGVPVEYVLFPNEGHGFQRRDNRITAQEAYLTFLNTYVRDAD